MVRHHEVDRFDRGDGDPDVLSIPDVWGDIYERDQDPEADEDEPDAGRGDGFEVADLSSADWAARQVQGRYRQLARAERAYRIALGQISEYIQTERARCARETALLDAKLRAWHERTLLDEQEQGVAERGLPRTIGLPCGATLRARRKTQVTLEVDNPSEFVAWAGANRPDLVTIEVRPRMVTVEERVLAALAKGDVLPGARAIPPGRTYKLDPGVQP